MNQENKGKEIVEKKGVNSLPAKNNDDMRKKLMKMMLIIGGGLILLLIIIFVISIALGSKNKSYEEVEQIMKNAAIKYYGVQSGLLPKEGEVVSVKVDTLVSDEYMKSLTKLRKNESCTGRVEVSRVNNKLVYTPYLDCGKNYVTKELYKAILEQKTVTSGSGLYDISGEKVYRGENINNYVKLDNNLFRVVKVTSDNKIMLILSDVVSSYGYYYDDRYNATKLFNSGFNDYRISRMYTTLNTTIYKGNKDFTLLSSNDKSKLSKFNLCIGKRSNKDTSLDNSTECSDVLENQIIGLLTVSDYMRASLDSNCKVAVDKTCQNYNYLKVTSGDWWLVTGNSDNNYQAYAVQSSGYISSFNASSSKKVRPVIVLNNNVMIKSGDGSLDKPFKLK